MKRSISMWVRLVGAALGLCSVAYGQHYDGFNLDAEAYNYLPGPGVKTEQLFSPVDISSYGSGPKRNEGFFGSFELVYFSMPAPEEAKIGQPGSSLDTSMFDTEFLGGQRLDLGVIYEDRGWLGSGTFMPNYDQSFSTSGAGVIMGPDPNLVLPPTFNPIFPELTMRQRTQYYGAEIMRVWRVPRPRPPQTWDHEVEFMVGARWMRIQDRFDVDASFGGDDINWYTNVDNNIVGPQIGMRYAQQRGAWQWELQGRFLAGWNFQKGRQWADFDQDLYDALYAQSNSFPTGVPAFPTGSTDQYSLTRFIPVGELRLNGQYYVTRKVQIECGWTFLYIGDGVGRASSSIDYKLPPQLDDTGPLGLLKDKNFQDMFMHGVSVGVVVNR